MNDVPTEFDGLLSFGAVTREVKIGNYTISMRTLNYDEAEVVADAVSSDMKTAGKIQIGILSNAITAINGKAVSMEAKVKLLGSVQVGMVGILVSEYEKMMAEQSEIYENVKKNFSTTDTKKI